MDKACKACIYRAADKVGYSCDYILITGKTRGCPPVAGCTVRKTGKARKDRLPGLNPTDFTHHREVEGRRTKCTRN